MPRTDPMDPLSHRGHSAERRRSRQRPNVARGSQRVTQKKIHRLATDTDKPATRRFDLDYASMQRYPEDPKGMYTTARIQGIGPSASCWRRRIHSTSLCGRKLYYLRYDRAKNTDPRSLSTSTTMITGPDRNRHHRIGTALSLWSRRAAGGLRRPSESRAMLAFPRLSFPVGCVGPTTQPTFRPRLRTDATAPRRSEDHGPNRRNLRNRAIHLA